MDDAVREHRGPVEAADDATMVALRFSSGALAGPSAREARPLARPSPPREWDVAVVGGGIYGAAVAWDAAQRGLAVALVEREDFGAGASWNSLKTIHGGMRYLQKLDLARLRQSARERATLLAIAPEIVRPLPFVVPTYGHGTTGREALALGLLLNDWLTRDRNRGLPGHRIPDARTASAAEALRLLPGLERRGLTGAALWHDAQAASTERLTLALLHAAAGAGALAANHAEAVAFLRAAGRVAGVAVRDALGGGTLEVRARIVVNAAGPWADEVLARGGVPRPAAPLLRARNLGACAARPPSRSRSARRPAGASCSSCPGKAARSSAPPTSRPRPLRATHSLSSTRRRGPSRGRGSAERTWPSSTRVSSRAGTRPASRRGRASTTTRPRTACRAW